MLEAKTLSSALFAFLAIAAVAAAPAMATEVEFHSEAATTALSGAQSGANQFTAGGSTVSCNNATFSGEIKGQTTTSELRLHPTYSGCTAFGLNTHFTTSGCDYAFAVTSEPIETEGEPETTHRSGPLQIECEAGKQMSLTPTFFGSSVCTITTGSQSPAGLVDFKNQGAGTKRDLLWTYTVKGVSYTTTGGGGTCGPTGAHPDGIYHGSVTTEGSSGGKQVGIWVG